MTHSCVVCGSEKNQRGYNNPTTLPGGRVQGSRNPVALGLGDQTEGELTGEWYVRVTRDGRRIEYCRPSDPCLSLLPPAKAIPQRYGDARLLSLPGPPFSLPVIFPWSQVAIQLTGQWRWASRAQLMARYLVPYHTARP